MRRRIVWRHSLLPRHELSYAPTKVGKHSVWECVGVEGREGGVRGTCIGSLRDMCVCGSVVCGNVVYVGVRGGCVNGEGTGIENMFHF